MSLILKTNHIQFVGNVINFIGFREIEGLKLEENKTKGKYPIKERFATAESYILTNIAIDGVRI